MCSDGRETWTCLLAVRGRRQRCTPCVLFGTVAGVTRGVVAPHTGRTLVHVAVVEFENFSGDTFTRATRHTRRQGQPAAEAV